MAIEIIPVKTLDQIETVAVLAKEIWEQHFTPIIGASQIVYMLRKFQSVESIKHQIDIGHQYYLASSAKETIGYLGLVPEPDSKRLMISKIYILQSARGRGAGTAFLDFIENKCKSKGFSTVWLTVNRFNSSPIAWYKQHGFIAVDEVKKDIGGGYFMDDFIMEKQITTERL